MAKVSQMQDIPWHIETLHRRDGDSRRHRSKCQFFNKGSGHCNKCNGRCIGSAHCMEYAERVEQISVKKEETLTGTITHFSGIKEIAIADIVIPKKYKKSQPNTVKISELIAYYGKNGCFDKPISVTCQNGKYLLEDKYLRYVAAKKMGLKKISARIATIKETKQYDKLGNLGTKVSHVKYGEGIVVKREKETVTVQFENGYEGKFGIQVCIEKGLMSII